ncbi:hypothetical protein LAL4801_06196 [Roseibium aggregatum]|uniref:Uncharacterized protein n=1 Tax=Roseibium aggregatum TaxID=187304 RepID=A0A0M6YEN9_9HYPH|nr:hypothetical protein LAL4801_06196 [Roseibium aggregatum]
MRHHWRTQNRIHQGFVHVDANKKRLLQKPGDLIARGVEDVRELAFCSVLAVHPLGKGAADLRLSREGRTIDVIQRAQARFQLGGHVERGMKIVVHILIERFAKHGLQDQPHPVPGGLVGEIDIERIES